MAARAIGDEDADYSFLIKQCSSAINCCSVDVRFCATRWPHCGPLSGGRCEGDHGRTKLESCRCLRTPASAHVGDRHHRHGRLRTCRRRRDGRGATDVHRRSGRRSPAGNTPAVGAATAAFCVVIAEPMHWRFSAAALNSAGCVLTNDIWHSLHNRPHLSLVRDVN